MTTVSGKKKGFFSRKAAPAAAAPPKGKSPAPSTTTPGQPVRPSPTPSGQASFTSSSGAASAAWPVSPDAPRPMDSIQPRAGWDNAGPRVVAGQQATLNGRQQPSSAASKQQQQQQQDPRERALSPPADLGREVSAPAQAAATASPVQSESSGFRSLFGRGKGKHQKNQSVASTGSSAVLGGISRSASLASPAGSEDAVNKQFNKGHASKPSASSYFSSSGNRSSPSSAQPAQAQAVQQQQQQQQQQQPPLKRLESDARSVSSVNTTFSAVSSAHPGASVPPPPLPTDSAAFVPANGQLKGQQGPPIRVRVFIDHPTTEPLYVTVVPGVETLRSFKHKILKTDNDRFIQFRQARRPPVETRWDISDSPFDDPKATGFDLDERIALFRVSVNWLVVSKTKRAFEKTRTFTSILSCCQSTPILAHDPNALLDLAALFPPSAEAAEARLKGLIEIVVRVTPRQSVPLLVSFSDMPDHPVVIDIERGMTVRDVKETIGEARMLIVRAVGGVQQGLENSDFYLFKCAQPCHKGPLPFDIDVFEGLSPETLFDDESELFEQHMFIDRTGWDQPQMSLQRVELVAFLADDMEDDFRESLRMHTKQGNPSVRDSNGGRLPAPPVQQQQQPDMTPAKAYASQQAPQRQGSGQSAATRKEDRHRSMPVQPRSSPRSQPADRQQQQQQQQQQHYPPQASPAPRNKHLSHQPPPRDYNSQSPQSRAPQHQQQQYHPQQQQPQGQHYQRQNGSIPSSSSVPANLSSPARGSVTRNVPKVNGTYSPVNMVSPSSSPVPGGRSPNSPRGGSPRLSPTVAAPTARFAGPSPSPRSPLSGGASEDDDDETTPASTRSPVDPAPGSQRWSTALINGLSEHKRSTELDPLELSNVNEGLGLDDILQNYDPRASADSPGVKSRNQTTEDTSSGAGTGAAAAAAAPAPVVMQDLGETIDRKLSNNSVYDVATESNAEYLSPEPLSVKLRQPFVGPKHGGFASEDLSPTSVPISLPEDDSPRSSESGPPSYQTNSVPPSSHGGDSPGIDAHNRDLAPSPQSSEQTVQQRDEQQLSEATHQLEHDGSPQQAHEFDNSQDYEDEEMSQRALTPDVVEVDEPGHRGQGSFDQRSNVPTDQEPRSLRLASITSSNNAGNSAASPTRGKFYHTATSGGRRNSYFNRTVATGYPLRSAMKGSKALAREKGELPPASSSSPARATFRRPVNTKVGNRVSRDLSQHRTSLSDRLSHLSIYQGKVMTHPQAAPELPPPTSAHSPRAQGSDDLGRKNSLGLVADGYALIGGALFAVSLKPMDDRGAAVMKTSAFQNAGQLWNVTPSGAPVAHGNSF